MRADLLKTYPPVRDARPYTRWWWFHDEIRQADITTQLEWVRDHHFGGVEIAWMYPQPGALPGPHWLSMAWRELVAFTKREADRLGLGCDFTFSTSWPFGGSIVPEEDASQVFGGPSPQRLEKSWELPYYGEGYIINHLDRGALERYADHAGDGLTPALQGTTSAVFCDSWEVDPERLWDTALDEVFRDRFGYDLALYKQTINDHPQVRYDYRKLISDTALEAFYRPYTEICHRLGAVSRVQCHGAPTDLLAAYAAADVPESEALLFRPSFSAIPASAAALASLPIVSAETFTCLYGWKPWPEPSYYHKQERIEDLKLLADAVFANGVNHVVWHGMPYNPPDGGNVFYATTHVGPDSAFVKDLGVFNQYIETVCRFLKPGQTYSDVAVYLPLEDNRMLHMLPEEQRGPAAMYYWELQTAARPAHLAGYHPLWISTPFLEESTVQDGMLRYGETVFDLLYVDVEWLDPEALRALIPLAAKGANICVMRRPRAPGHRPPARYDDDITRLMNYPSVTTDLKTARLHTPLVGGDDLPEYWCRKVDGDYHLFFAHPDTKRMAYPLPYEGWRSDAPVERPVTICVNGREQGVHLVFEPGASAMVRVSPTGAVDISTARITK